MPSISIRPRRARQSPDVDQHRARGRRSQRTGGRQRRVPVGRAHRRRPSAATRRRASCSTGSNCPLRARRAARLAVRTARAVHHEPQRADAGHRRRARHQARNAGLYERRRRRIVRLPTRHLRCGGNAVRRLTMRAAPARLQDCFSILDLRELARRRLPAPIFHYMDGGAEDEATLQRNTCRL